MDKDEKQIDNVKEQTKKFDDIKKEVMQSLLEFKKSRVRSGLTVQQLSEKSGLSNGIISELESKDKDYRIKKVPSLVNFVVLTRALGMSDKFVLNTILGSSSSGGNRGQEKRLAIKNALKDYGIQDEDSIRFLMQAIHFVKNRTINKKLGNDVTTKQI